jgi:hypothetical protein
MHFDVARITSSNVSAVVLDPLMGTRAYLAAALMA